MKFESTEIAGVFIVRSEMHADNRGIFTRIHARPAFAEWGLTACPEQSSLSYNRKRGTVRGLHYQIPPYNEAKLVVCVSGSMYDAVVDLRKSSATFGRALGIRLVARSDMMMVYVPEGCAHGFQTLEDDTTVLYMISNSYSADAARGVLWNDPALGLDWPLRDDVRMSDRDHAFPLFSELDTYF